MKHVQPFESFVNEADSAAWKSFNTAPGKNFIADVKQEISNWNWVANIAKEAEKSRTELIKILVNLGYDDFDTSDMGFEIRGGNSNEGPFQYRGAIFCNVNAGRQASADYNKILIDPQFKKYFESIGPVTYALQPTNKKYASMIIMNRTQLPK
jgi:hypothetical protein